MQDIHRTESYQQPICQCRQAETEYFFLWELAKLYAKKGLREKCDGLKPHLITLLPEVDNNPYSAARHRQAIDQL